MVGFYFSHFLNHPIWDYCITFYLCEIRRPSYPATGHRWNFWISGRHYIGSPSTKPRTKIRSANWHKCISLAPSLGVLLDLFNIMLDLYMMHFPTNTNTKNMMFAIYAISDAPFSLLTFTVLMRMMALNHQDLLKAFMDPLISLKHLEGKSLGKAS